MKMMKKKSLNELLEDLQHMPEGPLKEELSLWIKRWIQQELHKTAKQKSIA